MEQILLNWGRQRVIAALNRWLPHGDIYRRIEAVLDTVAISLENHH
ncbi:MAG: hypothetical protein JRJ43_10105 [Deltaproteobacteria bacterium]|nr:hypothetical protein [Deltaproteobacteria bacterium]MBW1719893.1 hypothetical protein [Deltaproteobacteria bacterium]MBW1964888.1 hypothetical protein [Deltaproteobacteria bacterium]MBW2350460.1 hypothetical protein [Deltaproteobacteria bacterium]